jgi:DNA ligase-1
MLIFNPDTGKLERPEPRRGFGGPVMMPSPYTEELCRSWLDAAGFVLTQPKLDGHHAIWKGGKLLSRAGKEITTLPEISVELAQRFGRMDLEGELYVHGLQAEQLNALVQTAGPHPDRGMVEFRIFDAPGPLMMNRRAACLANLGQGRRVQAVETHRAHSTAEVADQLESWLAQGYEGLVARDPAATWRPGKPGGLAKWKPGRSDRYTIIEALPGRGRLAGQLGALRLADAEGNRFKVAATGLQENHRRELWYERESLPGMAAVIAYTKTSPRGVPAGGVLRRVEAAA